MTHQNMPYCKSVFCNQLELNAQQIINLPESFIFLTAGSSGKCILYIILYINDYPLNRLTGTI